MQAIRDSLKVEVENCANCKVWLVENSKKKHRSMIAVYLHIPERIFNAKAILYFDEHQKTSRLLAVSTVTYFEVLPITSEASNIENHYQRTSKAFAIISKAIHFIGFKIILLMLNFSVSVHLHICLSYFTVLRLINGRYFGLATWWVNSMSSTPYFGFSVQDFIFNDQLGKCSLDPNLVREGVSCSLAENYLTNLVILGCMLVIGLCIHLLRNKSCIKNSKNIQAYSLRWPLLMVYGSTYELAAYSMMNFIYMHKSSFATAGLVLSIITMLGIFALGVYLYNSRKNNPEDLKEFKATFSLPQEAAVVTMNRFIKMFFTGIAAAATIEARVGQPVVLLLLELCYIGILFYNSENWSNLERKIEYIYGLTFCLVLLLRAISYSEMSDDSVVNLGGAVFAVLLLCLAFVVGWTIRKIYPELRALNFEWPCRRRNRPRAPQVVPQRRDENRAIFTARHEDAHQAPGAVNNQIELANQN